MLLVAPGQKISTASPAAEQFLGQSQRRLLGRSLGEVLTLVDERLTERFSETDAPINARQVDAVVAGQGQRRIDMASAPVIDAPGWLVLTFADSATVEPLGQAMPPGDNGLLRGPKSWRMKSRTRWRASRARRNCWRARWKAMIARSPC
jgi:two-component system nitrogen regulation sensor histidine kinase GlnL